MNFVNVGFSSLLAISKIVAVISFDPAPIKRIAQTAKSEKTLIDATFGRKTQSVIIMDCGYTVISSLSPEEIQEKIKKEQEG